LAVRTIEMPSWTTVEMLSSGMAWTGIEGLHRLLFATAGMNLRLANVDEYNRLRARVASTERERSRSFSELMAVVDVRQEHRRSGGVGTDDPLVAAMRLIAEHEGFSVREPARAKGGDERKVTLNDLANASAFRTPRPSPFLA